MFCQFLDFGRLSLYCSDPTFVICEVFIRTILPARPLIRLCQANSSLFDFTRPVNPENTNHICFLMLQIRVPRRQFHVTNLQGNCRSYKKCTYVVSALIFVLLFLFSNKNAPNATFMKFSGINYARFKCRGNRS